MSEVNRPPYFTKPREYVGSNQKKTLFLDMDETLVYCYLGRPKFFNSSNADFYSFRLDEEPEVEYCAFKRPGVDRFLQRCAEYYDICILTAGDELYAKTLLRWLTPSIPENRWYCRDFCVQDANGIRYKDLAALPGPAFDPKNTLLLDDSAPGIVVPATNGLSIPRFAPQSGRSDEENYERMRRDSAMETFGNMLCKAKFTSCSDIRIPIREFYEFMEQWTRQNTA
ncbi:NLI interacting factor-like phosphatase [Lotmaria passim]